jgi:hypothetical protein
MQNVSFIHEAYADTQAGTATSATDAGSVSRQDRATAYDLRSLVIFSVVQDRAQAI